MSLPPCKFSFEGTPIFDGYALGSEWNGFDNVAVTPATARQIADYFRSTGDADTADDIEAILPDENGLVSFAGGYTTQIENVADRSHVR
jgi:hypothetical protein